MLKEFQMGQSVFFSTQTKYQIDLKETSNGATEDIYSAMKVLRDSYKKKNHQLFFGRFPLQRQTFWMLIKVIKCKNNKDNTEKQWQFALM